MALTVTQVTDVYCDYAYGRIIHEHKDQLYVFVEYFDGDTIDSEPCRNPGLDVKMHIFISNTCLIISVLAIGIYYIAYCEYDH